MTSIPTGKARPQLRITQERQADAGDSRSAHEEAFNSASGSASPIGSAYRKDIEGLRFFAIVPVVLYHAFGVYIPSGFVGVDIFFVISGYLIGGIIYRESNACHFRIANFYVRRARRILPALLVVIACTVVFGAFILDTQEMGMLSASAQSAVLGISNIFFFRSIDYFTPDASVNPLLMTWSLGVEEQFYLLFPLILLAIRPFPRRYQLLGLMGVNALSLLSAIYLMSEHPLAGFYLLPARAWELAMGAALAIVHQQVPHRRSWGTRSDRLAASGLAMIVASCWVFSEQTPFPGYAALLPVSGTLLLLHTADCRINRNFLTARVFTGIGRISYSWYLWHWPIIAFVRVSANGAPTFTAMLVVVALSLILAFASWRYVEQPFRHGKPSSASPLAKYASAAICLLLVLQLVGHEREFPVSRLPPQALRIRTVQEMSSAGERCMAGSGDTSLPSDASCAPAGATVALFGDSHANHLRFGLRRYLEARGSHLLQLTKASCPPLLGFSRKDRVAPHNLTECSEFQARAVERILGDPSIRTVVLANFLDSSSGTAAFEIRGKDFVPVSAAVATGRGIAAMARIFHDAGKHVVVVLDAPKFDQNVLKVMLTAAIPLRHQLNELTTILGQPKPDIVATKEMRHVVRQAVMEIPGITVMDLEDQFCASGKCIYNLNGDLLYLDNQHLSIIGSKRIRWDTLPVDPGRHRHDA